MPYCNVKICGISTYKAKKKGITLHYCPRNPVMRKRWHSFCRVPDLPAKLTICSQHFKAEDFERRYQTNSRRILKSEAVPSIFKLPPAKPSARKVKDEKKARTKMIAELLKQHEAAAAPKESTAPKKSPAPPRHRPKKPNNFEIIRNLRTIITHQKQTITDVQAQLSKKDAQFTDLNRLMQSVIRDKDQQIRNLTDDLEHVRKSNSDVLKVAKLRVAKSVRNGLEKVFTTNQTNLILGVKKKVNWTPKEIDLAFSLRYHSKQAYNIVRTEMKIPLPCPRRLRAWQSQMEKSALKRSLTNLKPQKSVPSKELTKDPSDDNSRSEMVVEYLYCDESVQPFEEWLETTNGIVEYDLSETANAKQTNENAGPIAITCNVPRRGTRKRKKKQFMN